MYAHHENCFNISLDETRDFLFVCCCWFVVVVVFFLGGGLLLLLFLLLLLLFVFVVAIFSYVTPLNFRLFHMSLYCVLTFHSNHKKCWCILQNLSDSNLSVKYFNKRATIKLSI